ncbi:hypothetical protein [Methylobacterium bullatum]|uniref:hypothetical protein n=1 Tax=Methylobacterium bullatum TaxID=570505 RepID=UPI0030CE904C
MSRAAPWITYHFAGVGQGQGTTLRFMARKALRHACALPCSILKAGDADMRPGGCDGPDGIGSAIEPTRLKSTQVIDLALDQQAFELSKRQGQRLTA